LQTRSEKHGQHETLKHIGERKNCKKKYHSTFIVLAQIILFLEMLKISKKSGEKKKKKNFVKENEEYFEIF
jgi:hypothetical protein